MPTPLPTSVVRLLAVLLAAFSLSAAAARGEPVDFAALSMEELRERPGVDAVEVTFAADAQAAGLAPSGELPEPIKINIAGRPQTTWGSTTAEFPNTHLRHFPLTITDADFRAANHAAYDLFITYHLPSWGGVALELPTAGGGLAVHSRHWGATKNWKTVRVQLDGDAFRHAGDDGHALRLAGANGPLYIKHVRLVGYRGSGTGVEWGRLLQEVSVTPDTPDGIFAFAPGTGATRIELANLADVERKVGWQQQLTTPAGVVMQTNAGTATIPAGSSSRFVVPFDATDWPFGPYRSTLSLTVDEQVVREIPIWVGIIDGERVLPRARENDVYWFGLDVSAGADIDAGNDISYAYYDLMGVDVLRGVPRSTENADSHALLDEQMARLAEHGMRSGFNLFPDDWRAEGKRYDRQHALRLERLADVAERYGGQGVGQIPFIELGNEPDLPFFYGRPVEDYVAAYHAAYDAIKQSPGGRATLVMTGGLCFHTDIGNKRARRIIELLDPDKVDAWAFHGHGAGVEAERAAWQRQVDAVRDHARGDSTAQRAKPFIETESGVSGMSPTALAEQARTTVEKQVFAQSVGMPTLLYFRLYIAGGAAGYTMTEQAAPGGAWNQPRPSVLAYRHLVQRLRHHRFVRLVDAGVEGVEAYLFEETDADDNATGRKTLVAFSTLPRRHGLLVRLGAADAAVDTPVAFDMYGNAADVPTLPGNVAGLEVGIDSVFLTWTGNAADASADNVAITPPLIAAVDGRPRLLTGHTNRVPLRITPPAGGTGTATVNIEAHGRVPITLADAEHQLDLAGSSDVVLELDVARTDEVLAVPTWWKVFPLADADAVMAEAALLATVPDTLPKAGGGTVNPLHLTVGDDGRVPLAEVAGVEKQRPAVAYAYVDSPTRQTLEVGAVADWWMAWFVNGEPVYDTLETGNGPNTLADHSFTIELEPGRNVLAVVVLSGSAGFDFALAGPKQLAIARTNGVDPDRLDITVTADDGTPIARQVVPLTLADPIARLGDVDTRSIAAWQDLQPTAILGEPAINNLHAKHPDQSRWYDGPDDLSALVWLRHDAHKLHVAVLVRDDTTLDGDDVEMTLTADGTVLHTGPVGSVATEDGKRLHVLEVEHAGGVVDLTVRVDDHDDTAVGLKQHLDLESQSHALTRS